MAEQKYHVNLNALKGRIIEKFDTIQNFSEAFGCSYTHALDLLSGRTGLTLTTVYKLVSLLGIDDNLPEINRIFFSQSD